MSTMSNLLEVAARQEEAVGQIMAAVDYDNAAVLEQAAGRVRALGGRLAQAGYPVSLLDELTRIEAELRAIAFEVAAREFDYDSAFSEEERAALDELAAQQQQMSDIGL